MGIGRIAKTLKCLDKKHSKFQNDLMEKNDGSLIL